MKESAKGRFFENQRDGHMTVLTGSGLLISVQIVLIHPIGITFVFLNIIDWNPINARNLLISKTTQTFNFQRKENYLNSRSNINTLVFNLGPAQPGLLV